MVQRGRRKERTTPRKERRTPRKQRRPSRKDRRTPRKQRRPSRKEREDIQRGGAKVQILSENHTLDMINAALR